MSTMKKAFLGWRKRLLPFLFALLLLCSACLSACSETGSFEGDEAPRSKESKIESAATLPETKGSDQTEVPPSVPTPPGSEEGDKTQEDPCPDKENLSDSSPALSSIPAWSGEPFVILHDNKPFFRESEITAKAFESYASLDGKGRCGIALASCGKEIMPKEGEERGSISSIKPSGWVQAQYDFISGKYLYNRCHLIGWQLSAENANKKNLITGTKYFNVEGMLPFENMIADYVKETGNHVMYRVTPLYSGSDLVAKGAQLEAYSVEDNGEGICFNVFCYNVQPGVVIDYATGQSTLEVTTPAPKPSPAPTPDPTPTPTPEVPNEEMVWIPTKGGTKYHSKSTCSNMVDPDYVTLSAAKNRGFEACKRCH